MFESIEKFEDLSLLGDVYIQLLLERLDINTLAKALVNTSHNDEVYLKFHNNFNEKQVRKYYKKLAKLGIVRPESVEFAKERTLQSLKSLSDEIEYRRTHNRIQSFFHWKLPIIWSGFIYEYLIKILPNFLRSKLTVHIFKKLTDTFGNLTDDIQEFTLVNNLKNLYELFEKEEVINFKNVKKYLGLLNYCIDEANMKGSRKLLDELETIKSQITSVDTVVRKAKSFKEVDAVMTEDETILKREYVSDVDVKRISEKLKELKKKERDLEDKISLLNSSIEIMLSDDLENYLENYGN